MENKSLYCVKIDMFFNGKYKRRTPPINLSVRDKGLLVIVFEGSKERKVGGVGGGNWLDHR